MVTTDRARRLLVPSVQEALAESRARESGLRLKLDKQKPVGASARAAVAQSARKQAARQAETVNTLMWQNVQEAEDETLREAEKRAVAEEALAAALAERGAEATRAAEALDAQAASEAALRQELARSEGKAERLEVDVVRAEAVVVAERRRAAELEAKNDSLGTELRAALEEIGRLQGGDRNSRLWLRIVACCSIEYGNAAVFADVVVVR